MRHSRTTAALCGLCCLLGCNPGQDDPTSGTPTGTATGATTGTATGTSMSDCDEVHNNRTVGLIKCRPEASPGYTLFTPNQSRTTYLIDIRGELVNQWETNYTPGESAYLLENGHLLRTAKDTSGTPFAAGTSARFSLF